MFHEISKYDSRSLIIGGIDPKTATSQLREILAASGKGQGILSQQHALIDWAPSRKKASWQPSRINCFPQFVNHQSARINTNKNAGRIGRLHQLSAIRPQPLHHAVAAPRGGESATTPVTFNL